MTFKWLNAKSVLGAVIAFVVAGFGIWYWRTADVPPPGTHPQDAYATFEEFAAVPEDALADSLFLAFQEGRLLHAGSWAHPENADTRLVLATPTSAGEREPVACGVTHSACLLVVVRSGHAKPLAHGPLLRGFGNVLAFLDDDTVRLGFSWSILNFLEVRQVDLGLAAGDMGERVRFEVDQDDAGAMVTVYLDGKKDMTLRVITSQGVPGAILILDANGKERARVSTAMLRELTARMPTQGATPVVQLHADYGAGILEIGTFMMDVYGTAVRVNASAATVELDTE